MRVDPVPEDLEEILFSFPFHMKGCDVVMSHPNKPLLYRRWGACGTEGHQFGSFCVISICAYKVSSVQVMTYDQYPTYLSLIFAHLPLFYESY